MYIVHESHFAVFQVFSVFWICSHGIMSSKRVCAQYILLVDAKKIMFHYNFFSWILVLKMRKIDKEIQSTKQLGELKKYSNCNLYSGPRAGDCQLWKWEWLTLRNNFGGKHCHRTHFCLTHRQNYTIGHNAVINNTVKGYKMHQKYKMTAKYKQWQYTYYNLYNKILTKYKF